MIDAMIARATERHGIDEGSRIFHDKFTTSADAAASADENGTEPSGDVTSMRAGEAG
jgi:hypothetical protein